MNMTASTLSGMMNAETADVLLRTKVCTESNAHIAKKKTTRRKRNDGCMGYPH